MNKSLIIVPLIVSLVSGQNSNNSLCECKTDGAFEGKVEQSLLRLNQSPFVHFADCEDALKKGFAMSGVYRIKPKTSFRPFQVWCDMESDGGGWTLIQTRYDGLVDFYRNWQDYRNGFGSVDAEHWLGNNYIHQLTGNYDYELRIDVTGFQINEFAVAKYSPFRIGTEDENYKLYIGNFTSQGQVTDSLTYHNGIAFSTRDRNNDGRDCSNHVKSAWWYRSCYMSNLNGNWMSKARSLTTRGLQSTANLNGIHFRNAFNVDFYSLKNVEMKVRKLREICPIACRQCSGG